MVIIKTIISTLDVIFMLILFVSGRESKDKETAIAVMGTCDVTVAEHVSDVEVTECFIVQYLVFAFSCLSFVQRKEYI